MKKGMGSEIYKYEYIGYFKITHEKGESKKC
jgi:hypothetical protein